MWVLGCVHVPVCVGSHVYGEQVNVQYIVLQELSILFFWYRVSTWDVGLGDLIRVAGQKTSEIINPLPPHQHQNYECQNNYNSYINARG